jgi:MFS family permease
LAVSLLWPGTFSLAATRFPFGGAAMFGLLAVGGDAGAAVGPWLAGVVAEAATGTQGTRSALAALLPDGGSTGLRTGLLLGTLFPLGIVTTAVMYGLATRHRVHDARVPNAPYTTMPPHPCVLSHHCAGADVTWVKREDGGEPLRQSWCHLSPKHRCRHTTKFTNKAIVASENVPL